MLTLLFQTREPANCNVSLALMLTLARNQLSLPMLTLPLTKMSFVNKDNGITFF